MNQTLNNTLERLSRKRLLKAGMVHELHQPPRQLEWRVLLTLDNLVWDMDADDTKTHDGVLVNEHSLSMKKVTCKPRRPKGLKNRIPHKQTRAAGYKTEQKGKTNDLILLRNLF